VLVLLGQDVALDVADGTLHLARRLYLEGEALDLPLGLVEHLVQAVDVLALHLATGQDLVTNEIQRTILTTEYGAACRHEDPPGSGEFLVEV
jgi:hypothetical protein